ncbi:hypothetical protein B0X78_04410 [bacterium AM6]|nr:hypothetical protein B0X78_04410 [bacterium AM6]
MDLHRRDAYIVAVAPAVVFLGVYAYERGRYYFLRVAPDFIDLSLNRLLAGGAAVGALSATLVGLTIWMWKYSASRGVKEKIFAALLATAVFLALPIGLWLQKLPQFSVAFGSPEAIQMDLFASLTSLAGTTVATYVVYSIRRVAERARADLERFDRINAEAMERFRAAVARQGGEAYADEPSDGAANDGDHSLLGDVQGTAKPEVQSVPLRTKFERLASRLPWKSIGGVALLLWMATIFAGLGYRVERSYTSRLCLADRFVADVHGGSLILKSFDAKTGEILSPIKVVELKDLDLDSCSPRLVGASGLVLWP